MFNDFEADEAVLDNPEKREAESLRVLLTEPDPVHSLETVLYHLVEFYTRATKELESMNQWQSRFAINTQALSDHMKKLAAAKDSLSDAINHSFKKVAHDSGALLGEAASGAADKAMEPILKRLSHVCESAERQLLGYVTETKTFFFKAVLVGIATSLLTAAIILFGVVPFLPPSWLPLTDSQLRDLQLGSQVRFEWLASNEKEKKQLKEALGETTLYYLEPSKKKRASR
jgi:hypothetical protein